MKFIKILLALAVVFAVLGVPHPAAAQIYTYTTGYQVQNLSSSPATIILSYYAQQTTSGTGGALVTEASDTIDGLKSKTYFPVHAPAGFTGSVVISSSTPLASIANLVANGVGYASYIGFTQGSTTAYLPLLMKANAGYTTFYSVQNTGATDATVNIAYSDGTSAGPIVIKPNASFVFNQGAETHSLKVFAGKITSNQPIVSVVVQEGTIAKTILAQSGFDGGDTTAYMPLINANNGGFITGVQIQNIGAQATDITLSYTPVPGSGTACWEKQTVNAGASATFALAAFAGALPASQTNCVGKARFVGGAQVTANSNNMPIVAVVNQATSVVAGAYDSFAPSKTTAKVVLPLIMDRNSGWYTGFTVANVGKDPVSVTCVFTNTTFTVSGSLAPGGVLLDIENGKIADRYVGSGTCTATGSGEKKIVAVVNEASTTAPGDWLMVYEGINVAP